MVSFRSGLSLLAFAAILGCDASPTLVIGRGGVTIHSVLSPGTGASSTDSGLYALVAMQSEPFDGAYETAAGFSMTRVSDGLAFAWQWTGREGALPTANGNGFRIGDGNYRLAQASNPSLLSRQDLQPGDSVVLSVTLSNGTVTGRTRVPSLATPTLRIEGDSVVAVWPRDRHVGIYYVESDSENSFPSVPSFQSDTCRRLALDRPAANRPTRAFLRVYALDSALARYTLDRSIVSSGLSGGALGVFGAFSVDSVEIPTALFPSLRARLNP